MSPKFDPAAVVVVYRGRSYELLAVETPGQRPARANASAIACLSCGHTSYRQDDVLERKCGWCGKLHER